jgi:hypothetical protein
MSVEAWPIIGACGTRKVRSIQPLITSWKLMSYAGQNNIAWGATSTVMLSTVLLMVSAVLEAARDPDLELTKTSSQPMYLRMSTLVHLRVRWRRL